MTTPILLDKRETAKLLSISTRTVDEWRIRGRLPFVKLGYIVRFKRSDIDAMVDANRFSRN